MEHLRQIKGSLDRTRAVYEEVFTREQDRITGEGLWLERLTTLHVLGQELKPNSSVLDLGCGTGVRALPRVKAGRDLTAVNLVPPHIAQLKEQLGPGMQLEAICQDAQSAVDALPDHSLDAVLCLGPLYHLRSLEERLNLLRSCKRALKPGGLLFASFINNDWVIATMTLDTEDPGYITEGDYDPGSFRCEDFPFVFHTLSQADEEMAQAGLEVRRRINADGLNEMLREKFMAFSEEQRGAWFRFHLYTCEQPCHLGACNHWLFVCE